MRKKLVAGNWKMNGSLQSNAVLLDGVLSGVAMLACDVLVCVPFPYLAQAAAKIAGSNVRLGAQNVSEYVSGAYTGETAALMLSDFGCTSVLVGHSERRTLFGETDEVVVAKCRAVLRSGMSPVVCVGETLAEREAGLTVQVVARQVGVVLAGLGIESFAKIVLAYEPVWAIGTGKTATPVQAQEVHAAMRAQVAAMDAEVAAGLLILYGGSVKPQTAAELFGQPDIDGGLIGGAALVVDDFLAICQAAG